MFTLAVPSTTDHYVTSFDAASGTDVFLCRLRIAGAQPPGAVQIAPNECVVGFARRCTHMGCRMLPDASAGLSRPLPTSDGLLRCPCHASCFDLRAAGLVVIGPATDWLPMLKLDPVPDPNTGADRSGGRLGDEGEHSLWRALRRHDCEATHFIKRAKCHDRSAAPSNPSEPAGRFAVGNLQSDPNRLPILRRRVWL